MRHATLPLLLVLAACGTLAAPEAEPPAPDRSAELEPADRFVALRAPEAVETTEEAAPEPTVKDDDGSVAGPAWESERPAPSRARARPRCASTARRWPWSPPSAAAAPRASAGSAPRAPASAAEAATAAAARASLDTDA